MFLVVFFLANLMLVSFGLILLAIFGRPKHHGRNNIGLGFAIALALGSYGTAEAAGINFRDVLLTRHAHVQTYCPTGTSMLRSAGKFISLAVGGVESGTTLGDPGLISSAVGMASSAATEFSACARRQSGARQAEVLVLKADALNTAAAWSEQPGDTDHQRYVQRFVSLVHGLLQNRYVSAADKAFLQRALDHYE
jgi:hypothetical protein